MNTLHALIVDDNVQNLRVLAQMLRKNGVTSTEVADPRKLPTMINTLDHVDVVFLDLEMPGMNGYQAKELLKTQLVDTPIIAYTVHVSEISVVKGAGFDGFVGKPLDNGRFPDQLARILDRQPVWDRA